MDGGHATPRPALWGGLECTVTQLRNNLRDQFADTGHLRRTGDLEAVARLGLRKLRYPVSWERVAPERHGPRHWGWHDERLAELRRLGIDPIVGLVHHGSGPLWSSFLDPEFPHHVARHAAEAARRYPWVTDWTPVNEPVTTARFSGLYGVWHPHHRSTLSFLRILATEILATIRAMKAIRREIPHARLVQTEDMGWSFATPAMQGRADNENERRWLGAELLLGRVGRAHPWYSRFRAAGVSEAELAEMEEQETLPALFGWNHYVTSDRFLDHRLDLYPSWMHGGPRASPYVDTEAMHVPELLPEIGWEARLRDVVRRFPMVPHAVTECHLGATPGDQARWLADCWDAACRLRGEGLPVEAVTVWSLLGAVDWCSLLRRRRNRYEAGPLDVSKGAPVETPYAEVVRGVAERGTLDHAWRERPGWWRNGERHMKVDCGRV